MLIIFGHNFGSDAVVEPGIEFKTSDLETSVPQWSKKLDHLFFAGNSSHSDVKNGV